MSYSSLGQLVMAPTLRTTYVPAPPVTDAQAEAARQADISNQMATGWANAQAEVKRRAEILLGGVAVVGVLGVGGWLWYRAKHKAAVKANRRRTRRNPSHRGSGRSYGLFSGYSPSKARWEWAVSTPSGYGTFYKSPSKSRARAWAEKHMSKSGVSSNPLPRGYSRKTIGKIIGIERRNGKSAKQAAAIAYSVARKSARRAGKHPSYLRRAS